MMIDDGDGFFPERVGLFVAKIDVFYYITDYYKK